ncbi:MAG: FAD-binding and (Fe-S)-binding domain-containing protein [Gammaproteobacteria bacterium]|nr:FAD-binding and (Fe-S)-binding domain-containing protein [Gammaproteobacteria bacterium]
MLKKKIPRKRILTDALSLHAYAHDASHYLLIPKVVIRVESEAEVQAILKAAQTACFPITFRAAGTSLSGQAQTEYALIVLGENWRDYKILAKGEIIYLQPGVIGSEANLFLNPYQRKIGPDPASLNACKIGGIAANNASGMCCGIQHNTYHTMHGLRLILSDGTLLDTHTAHSVGQFRKSHEALLSQLTQLRQKIINNPDLEKQIRRQYRIKNTLGYSLNALIDFEDPIDILTHLMIGSEGTLAFIAGISFQTLPCPSHEAVSLLFFEDLHAASEAALKLPLEDIAALEIMDHTALSAANLSTLLDFDLSTHSQHAALLLDIKANSPQKLECLIKKIAALTPKKCIHRTDFLSERSLYHKIWNIRKGIFPAIAARRKPGSALINEDVAIPLRYLPAFCKILPLIFEKNHFKQSCIFGHAKDGNLHFLLEADFASEAGIQQYEAFMADLVKLVLYYKGALKAEHGTGRNMTHTIKQAFGDDAYAMMQEIKALFDPHGILNPDVILSDNPHLHLQNLKQIPQVNPLIDACIECGFCEKVCPSKNLSLTPRQRIVALRDLQPKMPKDFQYRGVDTCAKTGLCEMACPVGINTGQLMGAMIAARRTPWQKKIAAWMGRHFGLLSRWFYHSSPCPLPQEAKDLSVIYFPSCGERILDKNASSFQASLRTIFKQLEIDLIIADPTHLCCGLAFKNKGFPEIAAEKHAELKAYLNTLSENGNIPIVTETASCIEDLPLRDILDYLSDLLLPTDLLQKRDETIMLHLTCSMKRQHLETKITTLAKRCATTVIIPSDIDCCGFAGDKGFLVPKLNQSALKTLKSQVPQGCTQGYSGSPSCEIGLTKHSGIRYQSLIYLIERALG